MPPVTEGLSSRVCRAASLLAGAHRLSCEPFGVRTHAASAASAVRSMTPGRLYLYIAVLDRLAQNLQDVPSKLWQFVQKQNTGVCQQHLPWHRHPSPTDQAHVRDRMVGTRHQDMMHTTPAWPSTCRLHLSALAATIFRLR